MKIRILALMIILAFTVAASAQAGPNMCTNAKVAGTYSVTCSGWVNVGPSPGQPFFVPVKLLSVGPADADGNWGGTATLNFAGNTSESAVTGHTDINPDCTGTIVYFDKVAQVPLFTIKYVANLKTDELFGLVVAPAGWVVSCELKRMTKVPTTPE